MSPHLRGVCLKFIPIPTLLAIAYPGFAQVQTSLDAFVSRSVEVSPAVRSASAHVEAARASVARVRAGYPLQVELAPGVGFTNGNTAISRRFDIGGVRSAERWRAEAEVDEALAELQSVRQSVSAEAAISYHDALRARAEAEAAAELERFAQELSELVRRRVEIGEAPLVHATRAEIERERAAQEHARARAVLESRMAVLRVLADEPDPSRAPVPSLPDQTLPASLQVSLETALANRADIRRARTLLALARAEAGTMRAERRPSLTAGVAADVWSLDRSALGTQNLGLQAFFSFPLFDRDARRSEDRRATALVRAAEENVAAVEMSVRAEITRFAEEAAARRGLAEAYRTAVVLRTEELVSATRRGYEAGLSTLIEVIEAQRTLRQARSEYLATLYETLRLQLELRRAMGTLAPAEETTK
jgi:outer membrane protein, heavy metal efflux system